MTEIDLEIEKVRSKPAQGHPRPGLSASIHRLAVTGSLHAPSMLGGSPRSPLIREPPATAVQLGQTLAQRDARRGARGGVVVRQSFDGSGLPSPAATEFIR